MNPRSGVPLTQTDLEAVREGTQDVYDRHAKFWQRARPKDLYDRVWIDRFLDQQRKALPMLVDRLRPGGNLMLTIGPTAGEVTGMVGEEPVYHSSLDSEEYRALLSSGCFETLEIVTGTMEAETRGRSVLLAQGCMKRRR